MAMMDQMIEMEAIVGLAPVNPVSREKLEEAAIEVERVLDEHALAITDGASASANFETRCVEIDIVLTGATMGELYQKIALIVTQLDRHSSMRVAPLTPGATNLPVMAVQGSQMKRLKPDPAALIPA